MHRSKRMITLAMTCLLASAIAVFAAWAQDEEESACAAACHEAKARCVTLCSSHANPIQCDARCKEEVQDCLERCQES